MSEPIKTVMGVPIYFDGHKSFFADMNGRRITKTSVSAIEKEITKPTKTFTGVRDRWGTWKETTVHAVRVTNRKCGSAEPRCFDSLNHEIEGHVYHPDPDIQAEIDRLRDLNIANERARRAENHREQAEISALFSKLKKVSAEDLQ